MRDHVTEERISAYVDGELEGDELELVERLLADSAEHRQLLAELQELRASMQALPSFNLPADFHTRVVRQIDERQVTPSKGEVRPAGRVSKSRPWRSVLLSVASIAALVAFTVMLRPPLPTDSGVDPPGPVVTPAVDLPVYLKQEPEYVLVYDVTVTREGQKDKVVDKLLRKYGFGIDPALRLDEKLEQDLLALRISEKIQVPEEIVPYKTSPDTPKSTNRDSVEMIYVAGALNTLGDFGTDLKQLSDAGEKLSRSHLEMVIEPNKLGVMHRLHDSARGHFAQNMNVTPSGIGQAFRLAFRVELTSWSVPGAATFPMPTIRAKRVGSDRAQGTSSLDVNRDGKINSTDGLDVVSQLNQSNVDDVRDSINSSIVARQPFPEELQPGYVLLILRQVDANADDAE